MLIKDLSKEIDSKAMTAVRGGTADALSQPAANSVIVQKTTNVVDGTNYGIIDFNNSQSASVSQVLPVFTNYGLSLFSDVPAIERFA